MVIILTILGITLFFTGSYYGGNAILGTFDENIATQIASSIFGILLWLGFGMVCLICWGIYEGINNVVNVV